MEAFLKKRKEIPEESSGKAISLVNRIIEKAVRSRASDIHLEPTDKYLRVRYRIDGCLYDQDKIDKEHLASVISRIKVMVNIDIGESRLPQDGKIHLIFGKDDFDLRVSTMPTIFGEKIVLRLLQKNHATLPLEELGFLPGQLQDFRSAINRPCGMVLVTGPTGSGKTTTLYSALNEINSAVKNIITIEDPIEYELPGINQVQVNYKAGLGFAKGLRAILRQDPDVIMVGEIRDPETARIAVQSAMTGHLVFSTLHTNSASSAVERLSDMGIEPYLIASSLLCVVGQRLLRKTCPKCDKCGHAGFYGRTAIYEVLKVTDTVSRLIRSSSEKSLIEKESGMLSMYDAGREAVKNGTVLLEDLQKTVSEI